MDVVRNSAGVNSYFLGMLYYNSNNYWFIHTKDSAVNHVVFDICNTSSSQINITTGGISIVWLCIKQ